jgi:hypothetical protein
VPARGLHQVRPWRYGALCRARRGQALPARGLPQARLLDQAARFTAGRMEGASAASRRAAPSQSLQVPAVCTASNACRASSPTMRRRPHRNSLARRRRPKTRVASRSYCENSRQQVESAG